MDKIFNTIRKINHILLLLGLLAGVAVVAWGFWTDHRSHQRGVFEAPIKSAKASPALFRFGPIEVITGADAQMVNLHAEGARSIGYSSHGDEIRNILFLVGTAKQSRWLFPNQSNLILVADQLREDEKELRAPLKPTEALYFEYVGKDTNGDGELTKQDLMTVALSKPDGTGFVDVLNDVTNVLTRK